LAGVLAAPIRVMHHPPAWFPPKPRHRQRADQGVRRHAGFQQPAHHFAVEQVKHVASVRVDLGRKRRFTAAQSGHAFLKSDCGRKVSSRSIAAAADTLLVF
jgi:hypothetical protein